MCIDVYITTEQQVRADAILSRQLLKEEQIQLRKEINEMDDNIPRECYIDSIQV